MIQFQKKDKKENNHRRFKSSVIKTEKWLQCKTFCGGQRCVWKGIWDPGQRCIWKGIWDLELAKIRMFLSIYNLKNARWPWTAMQEQHSLTAWLHGHITEIISVSCKFYFWHLFLVLYSKLVSFQSSAVSWWCIKMSANKQCDLLQLSKFSNS